MTRHTDRPTTAAAATAVHDEEHEGLAVDLPLLMRFARPVPRLGRRQLLLGFAGGAGALAFLAACGSSSTPASGSTPATSSASVDPAAGSTATAGAEIPDETAGPFPGDGTNGPNALTDGGVVRNDIRTSFGSSSGTAEGVETTVQLTIVEAATGTPLPGAAVYLWHCNRDGKYSLYDIVDQNYLRGVQVADDNGMVSFTSIYPGCYSGRWPHAHFEVYSSIDEATNGRQASKTSQMAYPEATCDEVYSTAGYEASVGNLTRVSLATDNVFGDGADDQIGTLSGSPTAGYTAALLVRI